MVNIKNFSNNIQMLQKSIDKHRNMVIIADGATDYKLNQLAYFDSPDTVEKLYGVSLLADAFKTAKTIGVQYVFVVNVKNKVDYVEIVDVLRHYDFTYIVPLGINFSDTFFDADQDRQIYYGEFYLNSLGDYTNSTIMMTDFHASLYEDIDHFLDDMHNKILSFKSIAQSSLAYGRNLCLIANQLTDHTHANLLVASAMCVADFNGYPSYDFGPIVFDIDDFDVFVPELVYFKASTLTNTMIENLNNFRIEDDQAKVVCIDRVIKYIDRELDLSEYRGKQFSKYLQLKMYRQLSGFLSSITNQYIRGYSINSVDFVLTGPGVGTLANDFTILPYNSIEEINIVVEV